MPKKTETKTDKLEREYIIPLRKEWKKVPRYKRANKAVKAVKEFLARHMKIYDRDLKKIKIDKYLNEALWIRGIKKPPIKIKIKAVKEGDIVTAELLEMPEKLKFKKLREEKIENKAKKSSEKKKLEKTPSETETKSEEQEKIEEEKKEGKEKEISSAEATKQLEKKIAKQSRHESKSKTKEPKHQRRVALKK